jgi:copper transport protein
VRAPAVRTFVVVAAVAALAAVATPGAAFAHAGLLTTEPSEQSRVDAAPREVRLRFDQSVTIPANAIQVYAADGTLVSGPVAAADRGREMVTRLARSGRGAYTVRWRELSADGHIGSGVFTFGVGVAAPPPTEAVGASGVTWKDAVARWAAFVALAALLGPVVVWLVLLRSIDPGPRARKAFYATAAVASFAMIDVGILAFVLRASNALQLGFVDLLYGDLSPFAEKTRFGIAFLVMTVGFGIVALFSLLAWVLDRPGFLWPAVGIAAVLASGWSLSGHQSTEPNSTGFTELADWVHLVAGSVWLGGVVALAAIVWPLARDVRRDAFLRFARLAIVLIGLVVVAGTYLAIVRLPDLDDLWTTSYGRILVAKVVVVCLALAWGGFHHVFVRPRLERGDTPAFAGRTLLGESAVAMAVLVLAAVLVNGSPPAPEVSSGRVAQASLSTR